MSTIIFPQNPNQAKNLARKVKAGTLRRLHRGIYTDNLLLDPEDIIKQNWMKVVAYLIPNGILSFRTALELAPLPHSTNKNITVFVTSGYKKQIQIGPLIVKVLAGDTTKFTEQVLTTLKRSNTTRALLENLSSSRQRRGVAKCLPKDKIEEYLVRILDHEGEDGLNKIRDESKSVASELNMLKAQTILNNMISSLLASHKDKGILTSPLAKATARGELYDANRVNLFESFGTYLNRCIFLNRPFQYKSAPWRNLSFFESYLSNYIEGTEFLIDEAEDIVFKGTCIENRMEDSHDISSLFYIASDYSEMSNIPNSFPEFLKLLKNRHAHLMNARPDKRPGQFKKALNRAGSTIFVSPEKLEGTLQHGFETYKSLKEGMSRAIFIMFLITEVHPFDDGNGRIARIMMNAELNNIEQYKIIVPTAHRENYLNGLRRISREKEFNLFCKVLDQSHAYTASIDWMDYGTAREKLEMDMADKEPDDGLPTFNRALRKLKLSYLP